jgi:hypothetical protein
MAKTATKTPKTEELATQETAGVPAVQNTEMASMERPSFMEEGDATGTEGITTADIRLPRLAIAQQMSPQMLEGDAKQIEGLKLSDLFNTLTNQNYGRNAVQFIPIARNVRRIEFDPKDKKKVLDWNVPADDKRNEWTPSEEEGGKNNPPRATRYVDYIIFALTGEAGDAPEILIFSIKTTNKWAKEAASKLDGLIHLHAHKGKKSVPIYGVVYSVKTGIEKNDSGTFGVPIIDQVGYVANQTIFKAAESFAKEIKGKSFVADDVETEDDSFDAEKLEGEAGM